MYHDSVCSSVSVSVTSHSFIETAERIELVFLAWKLLSTNPTLCLQKLRVLPNIRVLSSGTLVVGTFATASRLCCQQSSSTVELVDHTYDG